MFPFRYSICGARPTGAWGPSGTVPFFHWTVFESGLGVSILGQPAETIETLDRGVVTHRCPEVHSPIVVPPNVAEALRVACRTTLESPKHRAARATSATHDSH
ncbi:MAG: hypothetical protein Q8S33_19055 [Myxococcales bacterium]|nr:hypothetical protein [Myxococcales bacterium]